MVRSVTVGFPVPGPRSGFLSDSHGVRPFATGGPLVVALSFTVLEQLPVDFAYQRAAGRRSTAGAVSDERLLQRIRKTHAANYLNLLA